MYTMDCQDPICRTCEEILIESSSEEESTGLSSEEESVAEMTSEEEKPKTEVPSCEEEKPSRTLKRTAGQSSAVEGKKTKLLKTVEDIMSKDLYFALLDKINIGQVNTALKQEVHTKVSALMNVLRERELELCMEIDKQCNTQVFQIDKDATFRCVDKVMKRYEENKIPARQTTLVFDSDFEDLKSRLQNFGQLSYQVNSDLDAVPRHRCQEVAASASSSPTALFTGTTPRPMQTPPDAPVKVDLLRYFRAPSEEKKTPVDICEMIERQRKSLKKEYEVQFVKKEEEPASEKEKHRIMAQKIQAEIREKEKLRLQEKEREKLKYEKINAEKEAACLRKLNPAKKTGECSSIADLWFPKRENDKLQEKEQEKVEREEYVRLFKLAGKEMKKDWESQRKELEKAQEYLKKHVYGTKEEISRKLEQEHDLYWRCTRPVMAQLLEKEQEQTKKERSNAEKGEEILQKLNPAKETGESSSNADFSLPKKSEKDKECRKTWKEGSEEIRSVLSKLEERRERRKNELKFTEEMSRKLEQEHDLYRRYTRPVFAELLQKEKSDQQSIKREPETLSAQIMKQYEALDEKIAKCDNFFPSKEDEALMQKDGQRISLKEIAQDLQAIMDKTDEQDIRQVAELSKRTDALLCKMAKDKNWDSQLQALTKRMIHLAIGMKKSQSSPLDEERNGKLVETVKQIDDKMVDQDESGNSKATDSVSENVKKDGSSIQTLKEMCDLRVESLDDCMKSRKPNSTDPLLSEEVKKDSSSDDDIEIISMIEAASIPSDASLSPPLPPKNRFKFASPFFRKREAKHWNAKTPPSSESPVSAGLGYPEVWKAEAQGQVEGHNPTAALRSSFTKYLEKAEGEWLASDKSTGQFPAAGKSEGREKEFLPILKPELYQWLHEELRQKTEHPLFQMFKDQ